ncbi:helix-turn-helix domain-containing protein [Leucobacter luti]|uniref:helix-turn-helix domain-containing protein n=1 Tax=Leucobacter luti TaxID=340320 RepID=UPI003D06F6B5
MTKRNRPGGAPGILRDLLEAPELQRLEHLHLASLAAPVQEAALISDIEEISAVRPDTLMILGPSVARGGWMISAALRYAWERRACGLIAPSGSFSDTVVELARRLGISFFAHTGEMTDLALDVAVQIGVARAGSLGRLRAFASRLAASTDIGSALMDISHELSGADVSLETGGPLLVKSSGTNSETLAPSLDRRGTSPEHTELVSVRVAPGASDELRVRVTDSYVGYARQVLETAAPAIRALLADARLGAIRASLPLLSVVSLGTDAVGPALSAPVPDMRELSLGWPITGGFAAVCLLAQDRERVAGAVHQAWGEYFTDVPLLPFDAGWFAFAPAQDDEAMGRLIERVRERSISLRPHAFTIGLSTRRSDPAHAAASAQEAWVAARLGSPGAAPEESVVAFDRLTTRLPARLMSPQLARTIAGRLFPDFVADPSARDLAQAALAYLEHRGSAVRAAACIGIHRNTLQSRLRRAEQLGIPLSAPEATLSTHLVLAGFLRPDASSDPAVTEISG